MFLFANENKDNDIICYRRNICVPQIHVLKEILIPNGMAFGRWFGHECGVLMNGKANQRETSSFLPSEDTGKRQPSMNQEVGSHQTRILLAP